MPIRKSTAAAAIVLAGLLVAAPSAQAGLEPGTPGNDVLPAGVGADILAGGPGDDVLLGEEGDDIAIWSPGDGSHRSSRLCPPWARTVPRVAIGGQPGLECEVVAVPATAQLGVPYLVRFVQDGAQVATIRVKDVESVLCPSSRRGTATAIDLRTPRPLVSEVAVAHVPGVLGAIVA